MSTVTSHPIKKRNLDCIRTLMRKHTTATKAELAKESKLSVVTLGSLMTELVDNGEVIIDELSPSQGGRPAQIYRFNADYAHALGLYILQRKKTTMLYSIIVDLQGKVLSTDGAMLEDSAKIQIVHKAMSCCENDPQIRTIAVGIPGQAVNDEILICDTADLIGNELYRLLQTETKCNITIENDMNAAVFGYSEQINAKEDECTIGAYFPIGIAPGAGLLFGQRLIRGQYGMAGEVSRFPIDVNWKEPVEPIEETIATFIQAFNAILAPKRVVIYRDGLDEQRLMEAVFHNCRNHHTLPKIVTNESLKEDYALGIAKLALIPLLPI